MDITVAHTSCMFVLHSQERKFGQRLNIIVLAEGAVDLDGNLITAESVKEVMLLMPVFSIFTTQCYAEHDYATVCHLCVCPSVCL